jgi:hypothetical protein
MCLLSEMSLTLVIFPILGGKQGSAKRLFDDFREQSQFLEHKFITEDGIIPLVPTSAANRRKTDFTRRRRDRQALLQRHQ